MLFAAVAMIASDCLAAADGAAPEAGHATDLFRDGAPARGVDHVAIDEDRRARYVPRRPGQAGGGQVDRKRVEEVRAGDLAFSRVSRHH
ncbi:MAG: hypothetical protein C0607_17605 [Azoarcus sp.]|nr:MAG: hypothetical protein C0607_17605 [Azoarcus sp.]